MLFRYIPQSVSDTAKLKLKENLQPKDESARGFARAAQLVVLGTGGTVVKKCMVACVSECV